MLSALIQNFDTVEKVIETSANSSGSALKENERYLDSIQGKIDQFNNAMQSMWSNTLDSDAVKGIVQLGTELVKVIDKLGLIPSLLIAISTISMVKNKMGPIAFLQGISDIITGTASKIKGFVSSFTVATAATSELTAATIEQAVANNTITTSEAIRQATTNGLVLSQISLTDAEAMAALSTTTLNEAEKQAIINKLGLTSAATTLTMATLGQAVAEGKITAAEAAHLGVATGLMAAQTSLTSIKAAEILTSQGLSAAHAEELAAKLGLTAATSTLNAVKVQQLMIDGILTPAEGALALSLLATGGAATTAATGFAALWTAMWPMLVVAGAIAAVWALWTYVLDPIINKIEHLKEELSDLKSELADIQSELDSVNQELETTNNRMAELLAKDSLSFVEEEELQNLQALNDELERKQRLLEVEEKRTKQDVADKAKEIVNSQLLENANKNEWWSVAGTGVIGALGGGPTEQLLFELFTGRSTYAKLNDEINNYGDFNDQRAQLENELEGLSGKEYDEKKKEIAGLDAKIKNSEEYVDEILLQMQQTLDGVEYGYGADEELDKYYNALYKNEIARGTIGASADGIGHIFSRPEHEAAKKELDEWVKALKDGDENAKKEIEDIIDNNDALKKDIEAMGLDLEDAVNYFVRIGEEANFTTLEGKIKEVSSAAKSFESLLRGGSFKVDGIDTGLADLFDEEGKIVQTKLSQVFQGTSDQTRAEITRLLEGSYDMIADGLDDAEINYLMNRMGLSFSRAILEIEKTNLTDKNLELFPGLEDEISGIIDTFSELTSAVGSVVDAMDTLDKARAEEAYSGSMSLETLEALMQSTDNYADLIEVDETGAIRLATDAQEILVAQKLEAIKQNAALALEEAELAYQEALHTEQAYSQTGPAQEFMRGLWNEVGGAMAFVGSLWNDLTSGNWDGAWDRAKQAKESSITAKETEYSAKAAEASAAVAEAAKNVENAEKMNKIAQGLTPENVKERYSSEEASGGADNPDEVADDAFQREMDYWENRIAANQAKYEQLQNEIDLLEAKGQKADASFYEEQIKLENERKWLLEQQRAEAKKYLDTIIAAGKEGSEEYWDVANTLNDIENELDDVTSSILDLQDAIGEIETYKFDEFNTRLDNLVSKLDTIGDLIAPNGEEDWFSNDGSWTDAGIAVVGRNLQKLEFFKQGYQNTMDELAKYQSDYAGNEDYYEALGIHSEQEWYDKTEELIDQQYDFAESISDTEQSIVDMYESSIDATEEYIETLIDGYNDYIDSVKEALDAERDLYDFKKKVQNESKNIAELERKIVALSGSTNKSDIAERRKLEQQLIESRQTLNDTYYDHAKDAQNEALDAEQQAYETAMTTMVEKMRISLEEATTDMAAFLDSVTIAVSMNAETVLEKYRDTEVPLNDAITNPWEEAAEKVAKYGGDATRLMDVWKADGYFAEFKSAASTNLSSPWSAGTTAANTFKSSVDTVMSNVVSNIATNVETASGELSKLYQQIKDTEARAATAAANIAASNAASTASTSSGYTQPSSTSKKSMHHVQSTTKEIILGSQSFVDSNTKTIDGTKYYLSSNGFYYKISDLKKRKYDGGRTTGWAIPAYTSGYSYYAKGTMGTTSDQWMLTDELGDELVMYATPEGTLSYARVGTTVIPADITQNLVEWGKLNPNMMNMPNATPNINMINNAVNKPEFNFNVDKFLHCDNVTQDSLPELKQFVKTEMNNLVKSMNYAIKGKGGR